MARNQPVDGPRRRLLAVSVKKFDPIEADYFWGDRSAKKACHFVTARRFGPLLYLPIE
jgi:hypothetical protein